MKIPHCPPFSKGGNDLLPLAPDPASGPEGPLARRERSLAELEGSTSRKLTRRAKGGAAVQSHTAHAKQSIGTLAPDGWEGF